MRTGDEGSYYSVDSIGSAFIYKMTLLSLTTGPQPKRCVTSRINL